jgi:hypothetical protein
VHLRSVPLEGALRERFFAQLGATLASRGIELGEGDRAVAVVDIYASGGELRIIVSDALMDKKVERSFHVGSMPADGVPLTLALATDELLRACWAELLLADSRPVAPVPPELRRSVSVTSVDRGGPSERSSRFELGVQVAGEVFGGGHQQLGGDVVMTYRALPRLALHGAAGVRTGFPVSTAKGEVSFTAAPLTAGVLVALSDPRRPLAVDLRGRATVLPLHFVAEATPPLRGRERTAVALLSSAGIRLTYSSSRLSSWIDVDGGVVTRTVQPRDDVVSLPRVAGAVLGISLGVAGKL